MTRRRDTPLTPCKRLLASPEVRGAAKRWRKEELAAPNLLELHRRLQDGLCAIRPNQSRRRCHDFPVNVTYLSGNPLGVFCF